MKEGERVKPVDPDFKWLEYVDSLFDGLKTTSYKAQWLNLVVILRRVVFVWSIMYYSDFGVIQSILYIIGSLLNVEYLLICFPYDTR